MITSNTDQASKLRELVRKSAHVANLPVRRQGGLSQIIATTSGKGGVGKSNMVVNLAIMLAQRRYRVIILDADLGLANADILLGVSPRYNLLHVIRGERELSEIILDCPGGIKLVPGGAGVEELANLSNDERVHFISRLGDLEDYADYILVDTGAGISRNVLGFVLAADRSLIVTTPEPTSMRDSYGLIKAISQHNSALQMGLLVNMVRDGNEGRDVAERIQMVVSQFLGISLDVLGYIYFDTKVMESVRNRRPFVSLYPNSYAAQCVDHIVGTLLGGGNDIEAPIFKGRGIKSFMLRLTRFFSSVG